MDRLLRPERFDTESTVPNAEKLYRHWKMTFQNYLAATIQDPADADPNDEAAVQRVEAARTLASTNKLRALFNNVSAIIYETISECTTYDAAFHTLDGIYIQPASILYNRHKLITCKQDMATSIDSFVQELRRLAKPCNFAAVNAEQNRNDYIREAFISGIASTSIRQRLLETSTLTLEDAIRQARALEQAQTQSQHFENNVAAALPVDQLNVNDNSGDNRIAAFSRRNNRNNDVRRLTNTRNGSNNNFINGSNNRESCFFCGGPRHPRSACHARNAECHNCKKKGHLARVCQSEPVTTAAAAGGGGDPNFF